MTAVYDLIIIGAGPAGQAAAVTADACGLKTLVLDEQHQPGGQIFRHIETAGRATLDLLGPDYRQGRPLANAFRQSGAQYQPGATVWNVDRDLRVTYSQGDHSRQVAARALLLASGAMERPVPIPGWELCGVMGAGAADILIKTGDLIPEGGVVLCGQGPLLLLVAGHLLERGANIKALVETTPLRHYTEALSALPTALKAPRYLARGVSMRLKLLRSRVPVFGPATHIEALGCEHVEAVQFKYRGRTWQIPADLMLLHNGVVPNTTLTRHLDCPHEWQARQRYWYARTDDWGQTAMAGVWVAGDTAEVQGAGIAAIRGRLAALGAAHQLGSVSTQERNLRAQPLWIELKREQAIRPFLDRLFQPAPDLILPAKEDTLVCRCEEITAGDVRRAVHQGCIEPNMVKALTRCGMGPCQGRMCGLTLAEIIAQERAVPVAEVGAYRVRSPLKPIFLDELAEMELLP